jgi:exosome complex RNA-binding protein Rrp42 (RNase PH superfamily)
MNTTRGIISNSEQKFIIQGCRENCRHDGRARHEFRPYSIHVGGGSAAEADVQQQPPLVLSHGSARVFLATGETHILVSVKAELVLPAVDRPNEGVIDLHVDLMQKRDEDLESTLSSLLLPHFVDTKELCIVPNHYVWRLHIDLLVMACGGGSLLDACSRGIKAGLQNTCLPKVSYVPAQGGNKQSLQVDTDIVKAQSIPGVANAPLIVTVCLLKTPAPVFILDATREEEACAFAKVHVLLDRSASEPTICGLRKAGGGSLPFSLLQDLISFVLNAAASDFSYSTAENPHHLLQETFAMQQ